MSRILRCPSPAMIVAIIALIVTLSGSAVAAIKLGALSKSAKDKTVGAGPLTYVTGPITSVGNSSVEEATASCPAKLHVIGGGFDTIINGLNEAYPDESYPVDGSDSDSVRDDGWTVRFFNDSSDIVPETFRAFAICALSRKQAQLD